MHHVARSLTRLSWVKTLETIVFNVFTFRIELNVRPSLTKNVSTYSSFTTALDLALMTVLMSNTGRSGIGSSMIAIIIAAKK
jgi:hypothetical protein